MYTQTSKWQFAPYTVHCIVELLMQISFFFWKNILSQELSLAFINSHLVRGVLSFLAFQIAWFSKKLWPCSPPEIKQLRSKSHWWCYDVFARFPFEGSVFHWLVNGVTLNVLPLSKTLFSRFTRWPLHENEAEHCSCSTYVQWICLIAEEG